MGLYKSKYATAEQIAEINKLADEGHAEALKAFGYDCMNAYRECVNKRALIGLGLCACAGIVVGLIESAVEKRKEAKQRKELFEKFKAKYIPKEEES